MDRQVDTRRDILATAALRRPAGRILDRPAAVDPIPVLLRDIRLIPAIQVDIRPLPVDIRHQDIRLRATAVTKDIRQGPPAAAIIADLRRRPVDPVAHLILDMTRAGMGRRRQAGRPIRVALEHPQPAEDLPCPVHLRARQPLNKQPTNSEVELTNVCLLSYGNPYLTVKIST